MSNVDTPNPRTLSGLPQICAFLDLGTQKVKSLIRAGMPVRISGVAKGQRYDAVADALTDWLAKR